MYLHIILVLRGNLSCHPQRVRRPFGLQISTDEVHACCGIHGMNALEPWNGLVRSALDHEQYTEVVIPFVVSGLEANGGAEFLFSQVKLLLSYIDIAKVVMSFGRIWADLQCFPERRYRGGVIMLIGLDYSKQVVPLNARRMLPKFFQSFCFCFMQAILLNENFNLLEVLRCLRSRPLCIAHQAGEEESM